MCLPFLIRPKSAEIRPNHPTKYAKFNKDYIWFSRIFLKRKFMLKNKMFLFQASYFISFSREVIENKNEIIKHSRII